TPTVDAASAKVGSEPTGVALSPTGKTAVVANFGDGTVSLVDTAAMTVSKTLDVGGLPRAVAVTNDGDATDDGEKAYVTIFYGVRISGVNPEANDTGLVGNVVEIDLATQSKGATITL